MTAIGEINDPAELSALKPLWSELLQRMPGVLRIARHAWIHNSRGCREHGCYLAEPAGAAEPVPAA